MSVTKKNLNQEEEECGQKQRSERKRESRMQWEGLRDRCLSMLVVCMSVFTACAYLSPTNCLSIYE